MFSAGHSNPVLKIRALTEASERRKRPSTYTDPLTRSPDMKQFLQEFYKNIYKKEQKEWYRAERAKYPTLQKNYEELCGKTVSYEDFWMRYERRCNLDRVMKELADKDAAQADIAKQAVLEFVNKAWSSGASKTAVESLSDQCSRAIEVAEVEGDNLSPEKKPSNLKPESPQPSMRESISKVLETTSWWTASTAARHPSTNQRPKNEKPTNERPRSTLTEIKPMEKLSADSSVNRTYLHGVEITENRKSTLKELKIVLPRSSPNTNNTKTSEAELVQMPTPSVMWKHSDATSLLRNDGIQHDNQSADSVALVLLLMFLIVTNLPLG